MMEKLRKSAERLSADLWEYRYALIGLALYYLFTKLLGMPFWPMRSITGFPCAGCGLTRAFLYLAGGKAMEAARMNPMAFPVLAFILYCAWYRYGKGTGIPILWPLLGVLVAGMLLFYAVRMYQHFPDRTPYVYTQGSLLEKRLPWYADWADGVMRSVRTMRRQGSCGF